MASPELTIISSAPSEIPLRTCARFTTLVRFDLVDGSARSFYALQAGSGDGDVSDAGVLEITFQPMPAGPPCSFTTCATCEGAITWLSCGRTSTLPQMLLYFRPLSAVLTF